MHQFFDVIDILFGNVRIPEISAFVVIDMHSVSGA